MKYIVLFITSLISVLVGFLVSNRYKSRVYTLESIIDFITLLETRVEFSVPITTIISEYISLHCDSLVFLQSVLREVDSGTDLHTAWKTALESEKANFSKSDYKHLRDFGVTLGTSSCAGQLELYHYYKEIFKQNLSLAKNEYSSKGKVFPKLGVFAGLFIAVVFI